ncbi:AAA family ATPase [Acidovorax sp. HDW3]|uniref:AAA family ATPase n=1 Tax=Acidovorax sp. HDW3 TaxID=2714923 RepID=UPI001409B5AF|nr:ATP-binding protein [Acidovorax sp. HDW3]QIL44469.1 AAA family ATPase [Acidovorax sp. HDW3]
MAYRHPRPPQKPEPHIALWMLRLLTLPEAPSQFVGKEGFSHNRLAFAVGLDHWIDPEDRPFDPQAARADLYQLLAQAQRACAHAPLPAVLQGNVQRLATLLGLGAVESQVLVFAVCLHTEPLLEKAADTLESLSSPQVIQTLAAVLDAPAAQVRQALANQGLLARTGLLTIDKRCSSDLKSKLDLLSNDFSDQMLAAEINPIELLRGKIQPAPAATLQLADYAHIQPMLDIIRPWLRHAQASGRRGVNLLCYGPPGTGKTELARSLAQDLDCPLFEVSNEDEDGDPIDGMNRLRAFRAAQSFLAQRRALLLLDEAEDVFSESPLRRSAAQSSKAWLNRALEDNPVPTLWLTNDVASLDPAFVRRFDIVLELPVPPRAQRQRMLQAQGGGWLDAPRLQRLAECEQLSPAVIARASSVAQALAPRIGQEASAHALERLVNHTLQAQGHRPLQRHDPHRLPELYDPAFTHADTDLNALAQGLAAAQTQGHGARLCLYGPPGTGKTAFGRWLAERLDKPLQVRRASDLLSMYVGEAEKNIARAFRQAEDEGALLLIDEVDSFLQDRRGAQRSWEVTQVNEMLTQMEGFAGIFIASTNLMDGLDAAALRRFDLKVKLDYLRADQAWALLQRHCAPLGLAAPGAPEQVRLARLRQLTPGDFAAVLRQQRFRPLADAGALVTALEAECSLKGGGQQAMGFV